MAFNGNDTNPGEDGDEPTIQPNSVYDQTIKFDSDPDPDPELYSPRPDPNDPPPNFQPLTTINSNNKNDPLASFELNFQDNGNSNSGINNNNFMGMGMGLNPGNNNNFGDFSFNNGQMFNNDMDDQHNFSPRPNVPDFSDTNAATTPELSQVFSLISKFQPPPLEISPHYKPFLPELVPSIGAIDAFIKVPRPDGEQDPLGLTILDEPTIGCANPQILRMQLREKFNVVNSTSNEGDGYIGFIEEPEKNPKSLTSFLESYDDISRNRAAPNMVYSYKMPDMEELMEFWPEELEKAFDSLPLPNAELDLSTEEYIKVICAMLDIPVKGNIVESLHVLFSLYQQFKENTYFIANSNSRGSTPKT